MEKVKSVWRGALPPGQTIREQDWSWGDWEIKAGTVWRPRILEKMDQSHIGLFLVSTEFLASSFIDEFEIPRFIESAKPFVPVLLGPLPPTDFPRLKRLRERQLVGLSARGRKTPRSYAEARAPSHRWIKFATVVFQDLIAAILERRNFAPKPSPVAAPPAPRDHLHALTHEIADAAHLDADRDYIESAARLLGMEELERLDLTKDLPEDKVATAIEAIREWACNPDSAPFFAVLGELGIGKTTTLKCLTRRLLAARKTDPKLPLPIFVDLRLYHNTTATRAVPKLEELLGEVIRHHWKASGQSPLAHQKIVDAVQKAGALIIFDGLDEKLVHFSREQASQFIREIWRILPPIPADPPDGEKKPKPAPGAPRPGKMLLSCRSHYFKDVLSQNALLLGEYREGVRAKHCEVCVILPFTEPQVREYHVRALDGEERAEAALAFCRAVHNLPELSRRPLLLSLLAPQIADLERRRIHGERILGVTLYENLTRRWLARDDGKHSFTEHHKLLMMEQLAAEMARDAARAWPWDRVEQWLGRFLLAHPNIALFYQGKFPDVLHEDFRTATFVLRPDDSRADFRFAHSSLGEYFHARHLTLAQLPGGQTASHDGTRFLHATPGA